MAQLIKVNGETIDVTPTNNTNFTLEELQKYVGGIIQIVGTKKGLLMVINEEGKLFNLQKNHIATGLYEYGEEDIVVGDVVIIDKDQIL